MFRYLIIIYRLNFLLIIIATSDFKDNLMFSGFIPVIVGLHSDGFPFFTNGLLL